MAALGGASRREGLLRAGVTRREIQAAERRGGLVRLGPGCYALPDAPASAAVASRWRGVATCVTALSAWGVPLVKPVPEGVHIALPRNRGAARGDPRWTPGVVIHRGPELTGVQAADAPAVVFHASRCLSPAALVVAVDYLLRTRTLDGDQIRCVTPRLTRWVMQVADGGAGSPPESLARLALLARGLRIDTQAQFDGIGRVDMVVEHAIVVEIDGRHYHSDPVAFLADRRRDRALQALGYRVLRFAAAEVLDDPDCVARAVVDHLGPSARAQAESAAVLYRL